MRSAVDFDRVEEGTIGACGRELAAESPEFLLRERIDGKTGW